MTASDPKVRALLDKPNWHEERKVLRDILLACGLDEAMKWNQLCYTLNGKNVAIIFAMKAYCGIGFFKGSLLNDPKGILHRQGEHSQAMRMLRFTSVAEISAAESDVKTCIRNAIEVEKAGLKVDFAEKDDLVFPEELVARLEADADLKAAFEVLTPGRQRGYVLHFSAPKQSKTRVARIEKCTPRILAGKGMQDR